MLEKNRYLMVPLLWALCVLCLAHLFGSTFSADSYSYYMIGKNLVTGNGYLSPTIRENTLNASVHSRVFPPLWPILCGISAVIFKKGIASGGIVNLAVLYGLFHMCYRIAGKLGGRLFYLLPVGCFFFIMVNVPFIYEIITGCSIPLTTLLLLIVIYLSINEAPLSPLQCVLAGICLGLLSLTRFDASLFCMIFPLVLCWLRKEKYGNAVIIYAGLLLAIFPWLAGNTLAFGTPFAVNQSQLALSAYTRNPVLSFLPVGGPTVFTDPVLWFKQRLDSLLYYIVVMYNLLVPLDWVPYLTTIKLGLGSSLEVESNCGIISILGGTLVVFATTQGLGISRAENKAQYIFVRLSLIWLVINIATIWVSRLAEMRYFSTSLLLLTLCSISGAASLLARAGKEKPVEQEQPHRQNRMLAVTLSSAIVALVSYCVYPQVQRDDFGATYVKLYQDFKPFVDKDALIGCRVNNFSTIVPADNVAYYTGWKTLYMPLNAYTPDAVFIAWKRHFHVSYIITDYTFTFKDSDKVKLLAMSGVWKLVDIRGL